MSRDKEKMAFGLGVITATKYVNITPLPKKPTGFVNGEWDFMLRTVVGNVMYTRNTMIDKIGSVEHVEMASAVAFQLENLAHTLADTNEDPTRFDKLLDLALIMGPLAKWLNQLHHGEC